jgi:hypothetical protein
MGRVMLWCVIPSDGTCASCRDAIERVVNDLVGNTPANDALTMFAVSLG